MSENTTEVTSAQSISALDKAIAAAKERTMAKKATPISALGVKVTKLPAVAPARARLTDEERAERLTALTAERKERAASKATERAAKLAERLANRAPAHLAKVNRAAEKLGDLDENAQFIFDDATTNLTAAQITILAARFQHFNRVNATTMSLTQHLEAGERVQVTGGDPRFIGVIGTLAKVQRIRCLVDVEGLARPLYLFTSDVTPVVEEAEEALIEEIAEPSASESA
jgi:hypothetical protein